VSTFNLAYNAGLMVKENVGYALTLDSIINTSEESDLCFIPFEPELIAKHNIVWREDHSFSKAAQVFLDKAKELETTFYSYFKLFLSILYFVIFTFPTELSLLFAATSNFKPWFGTKTPASSCPLFE